MHSSEKKNSWRKPRGEIPRILSGEGHLGRIHRSNYLQILKRTDGWILETYEGVSQGISGGTPTDSLKGETALITSCEIPVKFMKNAGVKLGRIHGASPRGILTAIPIGTPWGIFISWRDSRRNLWRNSRWNFENFYKETLVRVLKGPLVGLSKELLKEFPWELMRKCQR